MHYGIALSLILLASPAAASELVNSVPTRFLGSWYSSPDACGTADDLMLELKPNRISYWESSGPIKAIVLHGEREIALIAELSDEGQMPWLTTSLFRLSPNGRELVDATILGKELIRYRCSR